MLKKLVLCSLFIIITLCFLHADETLVITEEGNVGIGVDNPEEQLEVAGTMRVNGNITAGWFTPLPPGSCDDIVFYDLSTGAVSHNLPDAENYTGLHIVMWKGGDITTNILTLQPYNGQTIDNMSASVWTGQGNGKIILAPYDFDPAPETTDMNWVVADYIDSGSASGAYFQKFADGTMRQWGKKDGSSPVMVDYLIDFHDIDTNYFSGESVVTVGAPDSGYYTTNGVTSYKPGVDTCRVYIRSRSSGENKEDSSTGHWIADGRWY